MQGGPFYYRGNSNAVFRGLNSLLFGNIFTVLPVLLYSFGGQFLLFQVRSM